MESPSRQDAPSSVRRAFALLDAFTPGEPELSIRELARRSGVTRSTTHRLAQELLHWGALERGEFGLRLGRKLFELGMQAPTPAMLREKASPHLRALYEMTRLTVNLAVRDGSEIVYLEKLAAPGLQVPHTHLGGRGTLHATALGKSLLAFTPEMSDAELAALLQPLTPSTLTTVPAMRQELERVRLERVAFDVEESRPGLFCVGAPVLDQRGRAIAAISVTGATQLAQAQRFSVAVLRAAVAVGRQAIRDAGAAA